MKLKTESKDPLGILSSTKPIVESSQFIRIHESHLNDISKLISEKLKNGIDTEEMHFGSTGNFKDDIQLIFFEDVVNFCFWTEKDKPKWKIEWPKGIITQGGWYSLTKCFQRALAQKIPILNADYLTKLTMSQTESFFMGISGIKIPLLKERMINFREAGKVLKKKYNGKFINCLESAEFDAIKIIKLLLDDFPSFRDISTWEGKSIYFLKRAQICAQDFSYINKDGKGIKIKNIENLTAFADYKIPQMLRKYAVISYEKSLENKIDNYILIPKGSHEEIEIRSATIWCTELIRQKLGKYTASEIDNALWLISQDQSDVKPYHRTNTIYY